MTFSTCLLVHVFAVWFSSAVHCAVCDSKLTMVRVLFIHPDLGIGGAERLVVDAALALKSKGKVVSFLTAHHDKKHCFPGEYVFYIFIYLEQNFL